MTIEQNVASPLLDVTTLRKLLDAQAIGAVFALERPDQKFEVQISVGTYEPWNRLSILASTRGSPRVFSSLDSASRTLKSVGCQHFQVGLQPHEYPCHLAKDGLNQGAQDLSVS